MRQPKMSATPAATLKTLGNYVQSLETGGAMNIQTSIGDLLGSRVDHVRLWKGHNSGREIVKEVSLPKRGHRPDRSKRAKKGVDPDLLKILDQVEDPEISVDLTLNMENGTVSLAVEMEPTLVGQDLSALTGTAAETDFPTFDDEPFDDEFWSADEAAAALGVAKSTITRRIKSNELIGFRQFKNALYVPREQVDGKTLVRGIAEVLEMFSFAHHDAWQFLTTELFYGEPQSRPLDKLKGAKTDTALIACLAEIKVAKEGFDFGDHM
ncbi:helix-turn-helix transcriptional regulator [Loktanella sp. Alg231-35]|uniref:helix-turn-helix transcriptional regulator n=1 Tax=Loktanella sp. Alg231-35 TaxID=1922220 RepID=UPI00131F0AB1|nr:helix-turn-helix domain-containing protein [Loktanella sp. Alg231-35]